MFFISTNHLTWSFKLVLMKKTTKLTTFVGHKKRSLTVWHTVSFISYICLGNSCQCHAAPEERFSLSCILNASEQVYGVWSAETGVSNVLRKSIDHQKTSLKTFLSQPVYWLVLPVTAYLHIHSNHTHQPYLLRTYRQCLWMSLFNLGFFCQFFGVSHSCSHHETLATSLIQLRLSYWLLNLSLLAKYIASQSLFLLSPLLCKILKCVFCTTVYREEIRKTLHL